MLHENGLDAVACRELHIREDGCDLTEWKQMLARIQESSRTIRIALVGKYVKLHDAYLSVAEALRHAGWEQGIRVEIDWVDSEQITDETADKLLSGAAGIILPGGFGQRGIEGMICAAGYARRNKIPYFGICLGMQILVIEFARHVLGYADAMSNEFSEDTGHPVIALMDAQQNITKKGGTMRLGAYPCAIRQDTLLQKAYGQQQISERHRHRYEFNNEYRQAMEQAGLVLSGTSPDNRLVEAVELPENRFYLGVQYHPEFKSRPNRPHPLFREFIAASAEFEKEVR